MTSGNAWRGIAENVRRAATRRGRADLGSCVVEGVRLHERALRAGARVVAVLLGESFGGDPGTRATRLLAELEAQATTVERVPDEAVLDLSEGRESGLVGLVRLPSWPDLKGLLVQSSTRPPCVLVAVEIEDPGNVGALARTALASGAAALIAVGITDPWHPRAVRTSMGSVFKLPVPVRENPDELLAELDRMGVDTYGAVTSGGDSLPEVVFAPGPTAFFLGSEAFGLDEGLAERLGGLLSVPMVREVDSFSVNAAAAVLLYEFTRQVRPRA